MKIIVDIAHPAHVNFFKKALRILSDQGHEILITGLRRGKLPRILENELGEYSIHYVGKHTGSKFSIIYEANIKKFFNLLFFALRHRPDFGLSVGSFNLGAVMKMFGKPNLQFDDDPERPVNVLLEKLTSTRLFFPPITKAEGNVETMEALKEWAYLTPKYFKASSDELSKYSLESGNYIFVREVSSGSLNYQDQDSNVVASFAHRFPTNVPVLLSLEDKETIGQYPKDWILLEEPVHDIHSLIYHSRMLVSSGDSMAREAAMLGVPSIYCGIREMKANKLMEDRNILFKATPTDAPALMERIITGLHQVPEQEAFRNELLKEWDDITEFIISQIHKYKKPSSGKKIANRKRRYKELEVK